MVKELTACVAARTPSDSARQRVHGGDVANRVRTVASSLFRLRRRLQVEGVDQIESRLPQGHAVHGGPEVDHVAFLAAGSVETVEDVFLEVDAEGLSAAVAAVERAGPFTLRAAATETMEKPELVEDLGHQELLFHVSEVDEEALASRGRFGYSGETGRGDLFPSRLCRTREARGLAFL